MKDKVKSKLLRTCLAALALAALVAAPGHAALVGYWTFDEESGLTAEDSAPGNNNPGTLEPSSDPPTRNSDDKKIGTKSLQFDASEEEDKVVVNDSSSLSITGDITIAMWVKPTTSEDTTYILQKGDFNPTTATYAILTCFTNRFGGYVGVGTGVVISTTTFDGISWYHVALTGSGTTMKIYVNGKYEKTGTAAVLTDGAEELWIGADKRNGGQSWYDGLIDDVGIWNVALNETQIRDVMNRGVSEDPIPEPATVVAALVGLGFAVRRREKLKVKS